MVLNKPLHLKNRPRSGPDTPPKSDTPLTCGTLDESGTPLTSDTLLKSGTLFESGTL